LNLDGEAPVSMHGRHRVDPSDVPGEGRVRSVVVDGRTVALSRCGARLGALENRCPHQAGRWGRLTGATPSSPPCHCKGLAALFFTTSGMRFDLGALLASPAGLIRVPLFLIALLVVRGLPALLYARLFRPGRRHHHRPGLRGPARSC
jgi:nitrite reductase/ring-hydroxylating ferredoxin subunit